ncbi:MAG: septal ring lytic transglycosylase RlpA family protein [Melioribacteraceae bacterium]|jgi:rare lipoprotein A|nr:septal ring lytic transglycosylase RlpA family protein [Melioribacteraceae bacterium]
MFHKQEDNLIKIKYAVFLILTGISASLINLGDTSAFENNSAKVVISKDAEPVVEPISFEEIGIMKASWYGPRFHGKQTANGESYNQMALTAAHKTLPFGTLLRVTNLKNGESVIVRINDRGPFIEGRDLDLSKGTAQSLGMIKKGVVKVKVERLQISNLLDVASTLR